MRVLFDTNVLLDAVTSRDYDYFNQKKLLRYVASGLIDGCISSKQITDFYYVLRKYVSTEEERKRGVGVLLNYFEVLPCLGSICANCLNSPIDDYEDAVIEESAKVFAVDMIVTNNTDDFKLSRVAVVSPSQLASLLDVLAATN